MEIKPFDPMEPVYTDYIRTARIELLLTIKAAMSEPAIQPLPTATYLGLFLNQTVIGFS